MLSAMGYTVDSRNKDLGLLKRAVVKKRFYCF